MKVARGPMILFLNKATLAWWISAPPPNTPPSHMCARLTTHHGTPTLPSPVTPTTAKRGPRCDDDEKHDNDDDGEVLVEDDKWRKVEIHSKFISVFSSLGRIRLCLCNL